ncbi:MAG: hypothetical protein H6Q30_892 [Bacteroidetes bacterium]|nr:hypothetical protein [Bacteroidota bacterium]
MCVRCTSQPRSSFNFSMARLAAGFGADAYIQTDWNEDVLPLHAFKKCDALMLPDSYPRFLPTAWKATAGEKYPDLRRLEGIQLVILPRKNPVRIGAEIQSVLLSP